MGDLVALIIVSGVVFIAAGVLGYIMFQDWSETNAKRKLEQIKARRSANHGGTWSIAEFNGGGGFNSAAFTRICLIRMDGEEETGRIVVAHITDEDEDWTTAYEDAMAEARLRLASLQAEK